MELMRRSGWITNKGKREMVKKNFAPFIVLGSNLRDFIFSCNYRCAYVSLNIDNIAVVLSPNTIINCFNQSINRQNNYQTNTLTKRCIVTSVRLKDH